MNCKPNDLAVLVRNTMGVPCLDKNIGATVEVVSSFHGAFSGAPAWKLKHRIHCVNCGKHFTSLYDADLHPLRPAPPQTATTTDVGLGEREVLPEPV